MLPRMVSVLALSPEDNQLSLPNTVPIVLESSAPAPLTVRICAEIHRINPVGPLIIVTRGSIAQVLPSIAFAQRTAHRMVAGYVLVDPIFPSPAIDWPDAPVLVLGRTSMIERDARLRGWRFLEATTDEQVTDFVRSFVEDVTLIGPPDAE